MFPPLRTECSHSWIFVGVCRATATRWCYLFLAITSVSRARCRTSTSTESPITEKSFCFALSSCIIFIIVDKKRDIPISQKNAIPQARRRTSDSNQSKIFLFRDDDDDHEGSMVPFLPATTGNAPCCILRLESSSCGSVHNNPFRNNNKRQQSP